MYGAASPARVGDAHALHYSRIPDTALKQNKLQQSFYILFYELTIQAILPSLCDDSLLSAIPS